jgi:general secretion pathway protein A
MYTSHWQLERPPFQGTCDAEFYYPSEAHQGSLLKLRYAVENRRGAALLCGASGTGKTMLVQLLRENLPEEFSPFIHLVIPIMSGPELLAYVADSLGVWGGPSGRASMEEVVRRIENSLAENVRGGKHAVVVVDEAHLLVDTEAMETLRLLTNFQTASGPELTLVLVGQPPLLPALARMPQFEERLDVKSLLRPLSSDETASYIAHRLSAASAQREIFDNDALAALFELSQGNPRRLNRLCDLALLIGYADEQQTLSRSHIESVAEELEVVTAD